jgi:cohesin loading factor subunit SCC2
MDVSDLGSGRKKRAHAKEVREKSILTLYNKLHELVSLLAELLNIQVLTDTAVLHASSMGVAPFFVESVSELQLSALKLVTTVSYIYYRKTGALYCNRYIFLTHIEFC